MIVLALTQNKNQNTSFPSKSLQKVQKNNDQKKAILEKIKNKKLRPTTRTQKQSEAVAFKNKNTFFRWSMC